MTEVEQIPVRVAFRQDGTFHYPVATYRLSHPRQGAVVIELSGEHDLEHRDELRDLLSQLVIMNDLVVVDVTEAHFIDSSVLWNLVNIDRLTRDNGKLFRLQVGAASPVRTALQISGLLEALSWAPTRDQALAEERD